MTFYKKTSLETLRQKIDLVEVLNPYVDLKKAGASYKALCPFHDEKSPSFTVQRGDSHYHCFGCSAHGDAIQFLIQHQRMSFTEAIESLAERFSVTLEKEESTQKGPTIDKKRLTETLELATHFFHFFLLHTPEGHVALRYLYERGVTLEMIQEFQLGLASKELGLLAKFLYSKSFQKQNLIDTGLLTEGRGGEYRDFFSDRILIPIQSPQGSVIGFTARKYKEETFGGKYINTKETPLFKKSRILFGLNYSRKRIAKEKKVLIVEGQIDALRLIHEGFDFTVASQGTAFGEGQIKELLHLGVENVYLALDTDAAGQEAVVKIGDLFQKEGIEVHVVQISLGKDPDHYLCHFGKKAFQELLNRPLPYLTFLFEYMAGRYDLNSPAQKNQLVTEISSQIRRWNNSLMVHESLKKLSSLAKVPEEMVLIDHRPISNIYFKNEARAGLVEVDPDSILEADLVRWMVLMGGTCPKILELIRAHLQVSDLKVASYRKIFQHYFQMMEEKGIPDQLSLLLGLEEEDQGVLQKLYDKKINKEKAQSLVLETIQRILNRNTLQKREEIRMRIQSGECSEEEALELAKQFKNETPQLKL